MACLPFFFKDEPDKQSCKPTATCQSGTFIIQEATAVSDRQCGLCLTARDCAESQFLAGTCTKAQRPECRACHPSCATCKGAAATDCLTCQSPAKLQSGQCVDKCTPGKVRRPVQRK
jgi:hypothetical protein